MSDSTKNEDKLWGIIDGAITKHFNKTVSVKSSKTTSPSVMYESIEDYTSQTGKRFRKTKDQTDRNLTREQAFKETYQK